MLNKNFDRKNPSFFLLRKDILICKTNNNSDIPELIFPPSSFYDVYLKQYMPREGCGATAFFQSLRREKELLTI